MYVSAVSSRHIRSVSCSVDAMLSADQGRYSDGGCGSGLDRSEVSELQQYTVTSYCMYCSTLYWLYKTRSLRSRTDRTGQFHSSAEHKGKVHHDINTVRSAAEWGGPVCLLLWTCSHLLTFLFLLFLQLFISLFFHSHKLELCVGLCLFLLPAEGSSHEPLSCFRAA